jgi:hypothetical protein
MAETFDDGHLLESEGALKKLARVQAAAENEVAFEKSARVAEDLKHIGLSHRQRKHERAPDDKVETIGGRHTYCPFLL